MLSDRNFIIISSVEWNFLWQGPQEIASRLARAGNRVLYVENTGVRSPKWADARRVCQRVTHWASAAARCGVRQIEPNLFVCSPLVMPPFGAHWQETLNRRVLLKAIVLAASKLGMRDPVLWSFLPTNTANDIIRLLRTPRSLVLYYCVADFTHLASDPGRLLKSERALIEMSDLVFAQGPELAKHCSRALNGVRIVPYGVNLELFSNKDNTAMTSSDADKVEQFSLLRDLKRPIIGYVGGVTRHVDIDLLETMARARPNWSWVYVGPVQIKVTRLNRLENVHLIGHRPHRELPSHIAQFDVCTVPYMKSAYTSTVVPTKINEYLAMGKPVIGTPLPSVCDFNSQHDVMSIADTNLPSFIGAIERALDSPGDRATADRRRRVAALSDWRMRLEAMSGWIEEALDVRNRLISSSLEPQWISGQGTLQKEVSPFNQMGSVPE
jgi:glycosyltransferase involved in cell wall biosynthesis